MFDSGSVSVCDDIDVGNAGHMVCDDIDVGNAGHMVCDDIDVGNVMFDSGSVSVCHDVEDADGGSVCDVSDIENDMVVGSLCDMGVQITFVSDGQPSINLSKKERRVMKKLTC